MCKRLFFITVIEVYQHLLNYSKSAYMTYLQFRKFKTDWDVFEQITAIPLNHIAAQFYNLWDYVVQNSIINAIDVFQLDEGSLLKVIQNIVPKWSNPFVNCMHFGNLTQSSNKFIQPYLIYSKPAVIDLEFACLECCFELVPMNVKDQSIIDWSIHQSSKYLAWGKNCLNYNITNHFWVCRKEKQTLDKTNALIVHVKYDQLKDTYKSTKCNNNGEILAQLQPIFTNNSANMINLFREWSQHLSYKTEAPLSIQQ